MSVAISRDSSLESSDSVSEFAFFEKNLDITFGGAMSHKKMFLAKPAAEFKSERLKPPSINWSYGRSSDSPDFFSLTCKISLTTQRHILCVSLPSAKHFIPFPQRVSKR